MNNPIERYRFFSFIMAIAVYAGLIIIIPICTTNKLYFSALVVAWAVTLFSTYKYFWMLRERK